MDAKIKLLKDNSGNKYVPITHPSAVIDSFGKTLEEKLITIESHTSGVPFVKPAFLGDSLTQFGYDGATTAYWQEVKNILGFGNMYVDGIASTAIARRNTNDTQAFSQRYLNIPTDSDLVVVYGGTNDFLNSISLGSWTDGGIDTVYGALHTLCRGLINRLPNAVIVFMTPPKIKYGTVTGVDFKNSVNLTVRDYGLALIKACEYYGFPVYDVYSQSGIFPDLDSQKNIFTTDGLHYSNAGHRRLGRKVAVFLKSV